MGQYHPIRKSSSACRLVTCPNRTIHHAKLTETSERWYKTTYITQVNHPTPWRHTERDTQRSVEIGGDDVAPALGDVLRHVTETVAVCLAEFDEARHARRTNVEHATVNITDTTSTPSKEVLTGRTKHPASENSCCWSLDAEEQQEQVHERVAVRSSCPCLLLVEHVQRLA
jgi:hypothetical protein